MPTVEANDIEIAYETHGRPDDPTILLVMGFTAQLTAWDDQFCSLLVESGHHVVRYDNRDCGLSTKFHGQIVDIAALMAAEDGAGLPDAPYTLSDMAADGIALLDVLGIEAAHVVGASMGGMIVQTMAIDHPSRVASMTSIMSTTGNPEYMESSPEAMATLMAPPPADREAYIAGAGDTRVWSSKRYFDLDNAKARAAVAYDRSFYPEGAGRQLAAIGATGDREPALAGIDVPTLVIHGRDDTLITPVGGLRTAEVIDGAHMLLVSDMGHDIPRPLQPMLVDAISSHTSRAGATA